jgi:hypothetical protein
VQGISETLDAVIGPLNVAANYVDQISKGAIPAKITDTYNGVFNTIKNNLNACIDAVNALVADAGMLSRAAVEGKLATRADNSKHQGDYRKIVQGVNDTSTFLSESWSLGGLPPTRKDSTLCGLRSFAISLPPVYLWCTKYPWIRSFLCFERPIFSISYLVSIR